MGISSHFIQSGSKAQNTKYKCKHDKTIPKTTQGIYHAPQAPKGIATNSAGRFIKNTGYPYLRKTLINKPLDFYLHQQYSNFISRNSAVFSFFLNVTMEVNFSSKH